AAGAALRVVGLVAVDARDAAILVVAADGEGAAVARQVHAEAEEVARVGLLPLEIRLLRPGGTRAREDVDRARVRGGIVGLVAVDAARVARLGRGADRQRVAVGADREGEAEAVIRVGVRRLEVGLLRPRPARAGAREDIHRARATGAVVPLVPVDARGGAAFVRRGNRERVAVAAHGERAARQRAAEPELRVGARVRGFQVGHRREIAPQKARLSTLAAHGRAAGCRRDDQGQSDHPMSHPHALLPAAAAAPTESADSLLRFYGCQGVTPTIIAYGRRHYLH